MAGKEHCVARAQLFALHQSTICFRFIMFFRSVGVRLYITRE